MNGGLATDCAQHFVPLSPSRTLGHTEYELSEADVIWEIGRDETRCPTARRARHWRREAGAFAWWN